MKKLLSTVSVLAILALASCGKKAPTPSDVDYEETSGYCPERCCPEDVKELSCCEEGNDNLQTR